MPEGAPGGPGREAAKNVVARALAMVGRGTPEVKLTETGPPPPRKGP